jgi:hypothetical protein
MSRVSAVEDAAAPVIAAHGEKDGDFSMAGGFLIDYGLR